MPAPTQSSAFVPRTPLDLPTRSPTYLDHTLSLDSEPYSNIQLQTLGPPTDDDRQSAEQQTSSVEATKPTSDENKPPPSGTPSFEGHELASPFLASEEHSSSPYMNRRTRSKASDEVFSASSTQRQNSASTIPDNEDLIKDKEHMNNTPLEHRRRYEVHDGNSATQVAHLMSSHNFTLDEEPQHPIAFGAEEGADSNVGFWDLPPQDRSNFLLLVLLYFLQGIPMGLAGGSVPFLLKSHLSYGQIGIFSLASYPYSLKLLWSPIVDAVWSRRVGRRKSWILPVQMLSGLGMIGVGGPGPGTHPPAGQDGGAPVWGFTWWWFFLVFTCATQDIAVDGWALTLLSHKHIAYASTAQTVGLTGGQFLSFTVFLAFNSPDFANRWFRSSPSDLGVFTLGGYLIFWGWIYIIVTAGLAFLKKEEKTKNKEGIWDVYKVMGGILKLKNIQTIIIIHLIAKIGFQANDAVTNLKLLDKGFSQEDMALTVLIDFPFELSLGYYAGKWSSIYPPMQLWCWAFVGRLIAAVFAQFVVVVFPASGVTMWYLVTVIVEHVFSTFMSTVMFVAISAFHAKIADPVIGGTYMTLLATVSNLGGTFPRFFILRLVDFFTSATCIPSDAMNSLSSFPVAPFDCSIEAEKHRCVDGGGMCQIDTDGYYIVNIICVIVGAAIFWGWIRGRALGLQNLPLRAWRLAGNGFGGRGQ